MLSLVSRDEGFDPLELLHDLTTYAAELLPAQGVGVTVLDEDGQRVVHAAASGERYRQLEEDQVDLDEGPCLDSARSRTGLLPVVLTGPGALRWPRFAARARKAGVRAIASVPLRAGEYVFGALNLFLTSPALPGSQDLRLAQALADAAGACLGHQRTLAAKEEVIGQLQTALDSRLVIEQAKGILAAHLQMGMGDAFERLRRYARTRQRKLAIVAHEVTQGDIPRDLLTGR